MNDFPIILAGPIVRRVEPSEVTIWIATSRPYPINADFYLTIHSNSYQLIDTIHEVKQLPLGQHLYVQLITIRPTIEQFPTNQLLSYNLSFETETGYIDLGDLGLLSKNQPQCIVYGNLKYPSFYINNDENNCKILYGSCRKPHGEGEDHLQRGDQVLEDYYFNLRERPHSLFLMGDQIYADDIADPLFPVIKTLANTLFEKHEDLATIDPRLNQEPFKHSIHQINGRQYIMEMFSQFTSQHMDNHLMTLSEYATMYLLSFSSVLWEFAHETSLFDSFEEAIEKGDIYFNFPNTSYHQKEYQHELKQLNNRYNEQLEWMISFQQSLYRVQRLLANIPTYMIFDDHDITDDWNVSYEWVNRVKGSKLGKHIVANGLTAYWAFQGWGNDPSNFDLSFINSIENHVTSFTLTNDTESYKDWIEEMWNYNKWYFIAPTTPKSLFLDTRTARQFDIEPEPLKIGNIINEKPRPPQLISHDEWNRITEILFESGWSNQDKLIIVSATPVYGLGLIESFLHNYVYPLKLLGLDVNTTFDFEAWKYNDEGFYNFLKQVSDWDPEECIILSGDVHYSSSVFSTVSFPNGEQLNIKQFTSSPMKNMSFGHLWGLLLKQVIWFRSRKRKEKIYRYCDHDHFVHYVEQSEKIKDENYVWKDELKYQPLNDQGSIVITNNSLGLVSINDEAVQNELL
ncbi:hypothetical protein ACLIA0_12650 [Bacillaceae bacterium W0354]